METALLMIGGLALLTLGGEGLVRGSVKLAGMLGMSPLLIGITLVGFGTSTPEIVTSVQASLTDSPGIAIGNIVGSNLANILLILGIAALVSPVPVGRAALRRDGVMVVGTALLFGAVAWFWTMDRTVGILFLAMLGAYVVYAYRQERIAPEAAEIHTPPRDKGEALENLVPHAQEKPVRGKAGVVALSLIMALASLGLLVVGGDFLIAGAVDLALRLGVSESLIGLTIVAVGTSMPELVTSVVAAIRRQSDVALGNILGSNIYNILGVGGLTAVISPTEVEDGIASFDIPAMIVVSIALFVFAFTGRQLSRVEGAVLLAGYIGYLALIWPK